jgi:hypothetical protein
VTPFDFLVELRYRADRFAQSFDTLSPPTVERRDVIGRVRDTRCLQGLSRVIQHRRALRQAG